MKLYFDDIDEISEVDIPDGFIDNSWYNEVVETTDTYCPIGSDRQLCSGCDLSENCRWLTTG